MSKATSPPKAVCIVTGKHLPLTQLPPWASVRPSVSGLIAQSYPEWGEGKHISQTELICCCRLYVGQFPAQEGGELTTP